MSRIGILRPKHVGLILLGWWSSPRLIPFHNHTQYPGVGSGNGPQMLAAGKPGLLFRHLKWAELLEDVTLRGRTGLSAFKQICDLAQSSKAPGASNFLPLYANLGSTFFPILRCLEQVKDYGEKHFPPLLFLLWTCPFTPFPLMRKPTALVPLTPTRMGIQNCAQTQQLLRSLWILGVLLLVLKKEVYFFYIISWLPSKSVIISSSPWARHVRSPRAGKGICLVHSHSSYI